MYDSMTCMEGVIYHIPSSMIFHHMQGVENELTCHAYETHLRLALEKADLAEFTRCLTSLNELYHKANLLQQVPIARQTLVRARTVSSPT